MKKISRTIGLFVVAHFCFGLLLPSFSNAQPISPLHCSDLPLSFPGISRTVVASGDVDGDGTGDIFYPAGSLGVAVVVSGVDCFTIIQIIQPPPGPFNPDLMASSRLGDINGDGRAELLAGFPFYATGGTERGIAVVYDGATGDPLFEFPGQEPGARFGEGIASGDVNGDGTPDIVVGAPGRINPATGENTGSLSAYSGINGQLLYEVFGISTNENLGERVKLAGDVNDDGFDDIVATNFPGNDAFTRVLFGPDGVSPSNYIFIPPSGTLARGVNGIGDINNDGFDDIAIAYGYDQSTMLEPLIEIRSGVDGSLFSVIVANQPNLNSFGMDIVALGDIDADGIGDIATDLPDGGGEIQVFSGSTGNLIYSIVGDFYDPMPFFGIGLDAADFTGNGLPDLVAGSGGPEITVFEPARAFIRGDCDGDGNVAPIADGLFLLRFAFIPGSPVPPVREACNVDDENDVTFPDALYLLNFGFIPGSPPPPPPFPNPGFDPTP